MNPVSSEFSGLPPERYNGVARALHAGIALLLIANLALGLLHDALEKTVNVMPLHKSTGLTVLALTLVRIGWRLKWRAPPFVPAIARREAAAARLVHGAFYALMLALPLTGWIMSSAGTRPLAWFGAAFPKLPVAKGSALAEISHEGHEVMGFVLIALIVLHVAAALRHHYVLRDGVLRRMW